MLSSIARIYNNNVVQVVDEDNNPMILVGKGIGFQKKIGDLVDLSLVAETFVSQESIKMSKLLEDIEPSILDLSAEIVKYSEKALGRKLHSSVYLTLTDHLDFALKRHDEGIDFKNMLLWDVKRFYREEYAIALVALDMIENRTKIRLPEDEAGYIVFHLVNATYEGEMQLTQEITKMIQEIVKIIRYHFHIIIDESSMNFSRLITHLKYFSYRVLKNERFDDDVELVKKIKSTYSESYECVLVIKKFIEDRYKVRVEENELIYLSIHIHRILRDELKTGM